VLLATETRKETASLDLNLDLDHFLPLSRPGFMERAGVMASSTAFAQTFVSIIGLVVLKPQSWPTGDKKASAGIFWVPTGN
jgi:hypothetical protein